MIKNVFYGIDFSKKILQLGFLLQCSPLMAFQPSEFKEVEGLVVIEVESGQEPENWVRDTSLANFTGSAYLLYEGPDRFNKPNTSTLVYKINIGTTGKYRFQWRSRIAKGTSNTEHNDSWLRFKDASKFYAQKNSTILYPKGTGMSPNPNGSSSEGWFKIYQNARNQWTWKTSTSDNDPHDIFVEFDSVGVYTIEIAGRSNGHAIDRLVLFHSKVASASALDISNPESPSSTVVSTNDITVHTLLASPNPAANDVFITLPSKISSSVTDIQIVDLTGRILTPEKWQFSVNEMLQISLKDLRSGTYFLNLRAGRHVYQSRILKL
jgi:hypothetical protein